MKTLKQLRESIAKNVITSKLNTMNTLKTGTPDTPIGRKTTSELAKERYDALMAKKAAESKV